EAPERERAQREQDGQAFEERHLVRRREHTVEPQQEGGVVRERGGRQIEDDDQQTAIAGAGGVLARPHDVRVVAVRRPTAYRTFMSLRSEVAASGVGAEYVAIPSRISPGKSTSDPRNSRFSNRFPAIVFGIRCSATAMRLIAATIASRAEPRAATKPPC